ncbi:MAG: DUF6198 family protein [Peptostreptococcales bacterium]
MKYTLRFIIYLAGLFLLAIGINLAITSNLGVSPVSSIPLAISKSIDISLGTATIGVYAFYVLLQATIFRRESRLKNFMQLLFSIPFGYFVNLTAGLLQGIEANSYLMQLLLILLSIVMTSIGVIMFLEMDIVSNAPDGLVLAISEKTKADFGKVKIMFDFISVIVAIIISLLFVGNISIIREGTILSALLTGKMMTIISKPFSPFLKKIAFDKPKE